MEVWCNFPIASIVLVIISILILILGTIGNVLVVWIVCSSKTMWTATNILIANLALADIMVLIFDLPFTMHYQLFNDWTYGKFLCRALSMFFGIVVCISTLTLTAIAVDRYILIVKPLAPKLTPTRAVILAFCIFLASTFIALPVGIFSDVEIVQDDFLGIHMRVCAENWEYNSYRRVYTVITILIQFIMPLVLIACLYTLIFKKIRQRISSRSGKSSKTNRMLVSVVLVFVITWVPYQLVTTLFEFFLSYLKTEYMKIVDIFLRLLAMSSSCINPILYGYMNDNFHNGFIKAFGCVLPKSTKLNLRSAHLMTNHGERSSAGAGGSLKQLPSPQQKQHKLNKRKFKNHLVLKKLRPIELSNALKEIDNKKEYCCKDVHEIEIEAKQEAIVAKGTDNIATDNNHSKVKIMECGIPDSRSNLSFLNVTENNDIELLIDKKANREIKL